MAKDSQQDSSSKKIEQESADLGNDVLALEENELAHLDSEFENYKALYPINDLSSGVH